MLQKIQKCSEQLLQGYSPQIFNARKPMFVIAESASKYAVLIKQALKDMDSLFPIHQDLFFSVNTSAYRAGCCQRQSIFYYKITLNDKLPLNDSQLILSVLYHEILHSYPVVFPHGHTDLWRKYAQIVSQRYGIPVTRTLTQHIDTRPPKYTLKCTMCNKTWNYYRKNKYMVMHNQKLDTCGFCPKCKQKLVLLINH